MENILLVSSVLGFLLSFALLTHIFRQQKANFFLGLIVWLMALELLFSWGSYSGYNQSPDAFPFWIFLTYHIIPPAIWLFVMCSYSAIHEFGHSFVNHLLETTTADLIMETTPLYEPISTGMSAQGYPEWSYAIIEHFVRAGEVLIPELLNDTAMSESTLQWNTEERSFIYLPFIVDRLRTYRIEEGLSYEHLSEVFKDVQ